MLSFPPGGGGGGYSPMWPARDVPPVRAGFHHKISLKTGLDVRGYSVKTGGHPSNSVKAGRH